jgi:phosphoribosylamine--glycine ligase
MGYGSHPKAGEQLKVDGDSIRQTGAKLFYASVDEKGGHLYTTTSRSLAIVGVAANLEDAESISEEALAFVAGSFYARRDIGKPEVIQKKVERMRKIRGGR